MQSSEPLDMKCSQAIIRVTLYRYFIHSLDNKIGDTMIVKSVRLASIAALTALSFAFGGGPSAAQVDAALAAKVPKRLKDAGTMKVGGAMSSPPYLTLDSDSKPGGLTYELMSAMTKRMGLKLEYVNLNYAALVPAIQAGRVDVAMSLLTDTAERQQQLDFIDYMKSYFVIMGKPARLGKMETTDGICGFTAAVQSGALQDDFVRQQSATCVKKGLKAIDLIVVPTTADAQLQVMNGRADFFVTAYASGKDYEKVSDAKIVGPLVMPQYHGAAVKKGDQELVSLMDAAMRSIMDDGTYGKIVDKFDLSILKMDAPVINGATTRPLQ